MGGQYRLPPVRVKLMRADADAAQTDPPDGEHEKWWVIAAAAPKNEMAILGELGAGFGTERRIAALVSAAARLMRAFAMQVEVLRRLRHGGQQFVRVEHVHVNEGGQAVIGNVKNPDTQGERRLRHGVIY